VNFFCFSFLCKYKLVAAYAKAHPLIIYNPVEIGSDELITPNINAVGTVNIATLTSVVNNLTLTPVWYFVNSFFLGIRSIFTSFLYLGLMGIPFFPFLCNILAIFLLYVKFLFVLMFCKSFDIFF